MRRFEMEQRKSNKEKAQELYDGLETLCDSWDVLEELVRIIEDELVKCGARNAEKKFTIYEIEKHLEKLEGG